MGELEFKTIIEPYRVKSVEPIKMTTKAQRTDFLKKAGLNPFLLKSEDVLIDLLTDSGTSAMSTDQWAGVMRADESYAGSPSYYRFEEAVKNVTTHAEVIPTHQGRASERILFSTLLKPGHLVLSNMLFDTTRANAEAVKCETVDLPCIESADPLVPAPFKGNVNLIALEKALRENGKNVGLIVLTITNNSGGGQPVSLANIRAVKELAVEHKVPLMIDGCRFAENAWFIKLREKGQEHRSPLEISQDIFKLADIVSISAKKDGMGNMGGILTMQNPDWAQACRNNLILTEGFPTYGGLSGRDLEAIAIGLFEALNEDYLRCRIRSTEYVGERFLKAGIPIITPPGGHAIYIDAKALLSHIPVNQYPGWALSAALYEFAGIRSCEIGSVMFGKKPDGSELPHKYELVRLAIPRRVYTQSHMDYVCEALEKFKSFASQVRGVKFTYQPQALRHFTSRFEWVS